MYTQIKVVLNKKSAQMPESEDLKPSNPLPAEAFFRRRRGKPLKLTSKHPFVF